MRIAVGWIEYPAKTKLWRLMFPEGGRRSPGHRDFYAKHYSVSGLAACPVIVSNCRTLARQFSYTVKFQVAFLKDACYEEESVLILPFFACGHIARGLLPLNPISPQTS